MTVPPLIRRLAGYPVLRWKRRHLTRFRRDMGRVREAQTERLKAIVQASLGSAFAQDFDLSKVRTPDDLRLALPVAPYERMEPYIERAKAGEVAALFRPGTKILMFATTSGTTAAAKFIPVTRASLAEYQDSWTVWGCALAEAHPKLPYGGLINLASTWRAAATSSGVPCGSITGLIFKMMHRTLRYTNVVPPEAALVGDPVLRQYLALRLALVRRDVMMITTANPSTLLGFARRLDEWKDDLLRDLHDGTLRHSGDYAAETRQAVRWQLRPDPKLARQLTAAAQGGVLFPRHAWPDLELLGVWTGGTLASYLPKLPEYYGGVALRDHGLSASEGRMTIPLADGRPDGALNVFGSFYEFIPEEAYGREPVRTLLAHELEVGERYYLVVTTSGGLFRYDLADVVECTGYLRGTPLLKFLHKGREISSLTGEKLSAFQVAEALRRVQAELGVFLGECTLAPAFDDPPGYHLLIEAAEFPALSLAATLATALDRELQALNIEYADKRLTGRLHPVVTTPSADGCFLALREERLARSGGAPEQYKHPFLVTDLSFVGRVRRPAAVKRSG